METGEIRSWVEGPRWARSDVAIKNLAHEIGLDYTVDRETRFLTETVRYLVKGTEDQLLKFRAVLLKSISDYNN